jgi:hypothetical protein
MSDWSLSVEPSTFEGVATYSLLFTKRAEPPRVPDGVPPPPGGWPTPDPIISAAQEAQVRFHIDAKTHLPLAIVQSLDSDPDRRTTGGLIRFNGSFISADKLPAGGFSPDALGYIPPDEEERRKLERPDLQTPVYWLGRTFDPGGGLPVLGGLYVNSYGPRPSRGDEPNIQLGLAYRGSDGGVRLDIYPPGDWEEFTVRLGGNFPWTWCSASREFVTANATVTIRAAYEAFPYHFDGHVVAVRPGETPPPPAPPTIPPLKTEPCPTTPPDRFLAEVRFKDATVVINGTLSYGGQDGTHWGVFDTPAALEAVARGIKLRNPGE